MRCLSLRVRLLLIVLAFVAAGLVISNVIVLHALRNDLMDRIDGQLRTLANVYSRTRLRVRRCGSASVPVPARPFSRWPTRGPG